MFVLFVIFLLTVDAVHVHVYTLSTMLRHYVDEYTYKNNHTLHTAHTGNPTKMHAQTLCLRISVYIRSDISTHPSTHTQTSTSLVHALHQDSDAVLDPHTQKANLHGVVRKCHTHARGLLYVS